MLLVEIIDSKGQPVTVWAGRVVIREASTGTPLAVAAATGQRSYEVSAVRSPDFADALTKLGIPPVKVIDGKNLRAKPGVR